MDGGFISTTADGREAEPEEAEKTEGFHETAEQLSVAAVEVTPGSPAEMPAVTDAVVGPEGEVK